MAGYKSYKVVTEFSINSTKDDNTITTQLRVGDTVEIDGSNIIIDGKDVGESTSISKVIGTWLVEGDAVNKDNTPDNSTEHGDSSSHDSDSKGSAIAYKSVESFVNSIDLAKIGIDIDGIDKGTVTDKIRKDLVDILIKYVKSVKPVRVINDDQKEVSTISNVDGSAETRGSSTVELGASKFDKKASVMSDKDTVYKETSYNTTEKSVSEKRVDKVVEEEGSVIETSYGDWGSTDIGSSTQTKTSRVVESSDPTSSLKPAGDNQDALTGDNQDALIVGKVSDVPVVEQDGVEAGLTVGGNNSSTDKGVVVSSNNSIDVGEATFGSKDTAGSTDSIDVDGIIKSI